MNPYGAPAYMAEKYDDPDPPKLSDSEVEALRRSLLEWASTWTNRHPDWLTTCGPTL